MKPSPVPDHRSLPVLYEAYNLLRFNRFSLASLVLLGLMVSDSQRLVHAAGNDDNGLETRVVQSPSIPAFSDSILSYFPLNTGNFWQYGIHYDPAWCAGNYDTTYYSIEVIGDTLMSNGYTYKIVTGSYYRIDTSSANVYQFTDTFGDCLSDSLRAEQGDYFITCYGGFEECLAVEPTSILGTPTIAKYFSAGIGYGYSLALGFGLTSSGYTDPFQHCIFTELTDLFYARIDGVEYGTLVDVKEEAGMIPELFVLSQNYPNPFNPSTTINYALPRSSYVKLEVFNVLGERVSVLRDGVQDAGYHSVVFDAKGLPSGMYFYKLQAEDFVETKKLVLLK